METNAEAGFPDQETDANAEENSDSSSTLYKIVEEIMNFV